MYFSDGVKKPQTRKDFGKKILAGFVFFVICA